MTTPLTPAGWYPDPEDSGGQRYWDGSAWTEHRAPLAPKPEPPAEQPTAVVPTISAPPGQRVGAHRRPDPEPEASEPEPEPVPEPEPAPEPEPGVTARISQRTPPPVEPPAEPTFEPAQPEAGVTARISQWTPPPVEPPAEPTFEPAPAFAAPAARASAPGDNSKKLIAWYGAACAALLAVLALVLVYALFLHDPDTRQLATPTTTPAETTAQEPTSEASSPGWGAPTETPSETQAPAAGGESVDGPLQFTLIGVETGSTVSSTEAPVDKTAVGEYIVVRMNVLNQSDAPAQFLGTLQKLHAGGTTYNIDDEASFYLGGGFVEIPPGGEAAVGVAFDVPPGTVAESIELHFDPLSPGVQLPLG